ncbi:MAG: hypothetical protein IRZ00_19775 [Gemmatimonadetes bacterium]|nr:hypothetical protein [Gemmatimonadota bacterium]
MSASPTPRSGGERVIPSARPSGPPPSRLLYGNATILVVGPARPALVALREWAERRGYRVFAEADAGAALCRAAAERPAITVVAALPSPLPFVETLRSRKETQDTVIAVALRDATPARIRALRALRVVALAGDVPASAWRVLVERLEDGGAALTTGGVQADVPAPEAPEPATPGY